ncbi:Hok/gef family protein [Klebsiella pneumoniae subsp. rhinoscleromatis ATCC 13884]|nr:Hok/gef family protein [Klebsiella pneumoniae subsp. rhinoscleromatis ATCC 13884]
MLHQHQVTPLLTLRYLQYLCELTQEKKAMKLPRNALVWCVLIVCLTLLIFTCLTRNRLCEVRLKDGNREVAASLAYESNGK